ncbi:MAG: tryptophan synthase subunit alpha [Bacteroidetes bacterium]|nr:tryptophan synthase subunit alpha [Bacteroidota bacterium]
MKSLKETIKTNRKNLSIFFTAGFPKKESTIEILKSLNETDVDFIEIGIPFSDPLADGEVIQQASTISLNNGMSLDLLFKQLISAKTFNKKPCLLMGYLNSLLAFGIENFYKKCNEAEVKHIIIPDLPITEYILFHKKIAAQYGVSPVFLVTPSTSVARIKEIDKLSDAFIYLVSSNSTTGNVANIQENKINAIAKLKLNNPIILGFGIKNKIDYEKACSLSNGAIVGTAFIKILSESKDLNTDIKKFITNIKSN